MGHIPVSGLHNLEVIPKWCYAQPPHEDPNSIPTPSPPRKKLSLSRQEGPLGADSCISTSLADESIPSVTSDAA